MGGGGLDPYTIHSRTKRGRVWSWPRSDTRMLAPGSTSPKAVTCPCTTSPPPLLQASGAKSEPPAGLAVGLPGHGKEAPQDENQQASRTHATHVPARTRKTAAPLTKPPPPPHRPAGPPARPAAPTGQPEAVHGAFSAAHEPVQASPETPSLVHRPGPPPQPVQASPETAPRSST